MKHDQYSEMISKRLGESWFLSEPLFRACLKIMKRETMPITFVIAFYFGTAFSHLERVVHERAAETITPAPGGAGRGEGGLQTKIILPFRIFRPALGLGKRFSCKAKTRGDRSNKKFLAPLVYLNNGVESSFRKVSTKV